MYRQLYPQHKNSAFILAADSAGLADSDSDNGSRVRSNAARRHNLVKSGEGLLASAASHTRKGSINPLQMTARGSPMHAGKINILQNTPAQMQQHRNNYLHASSSIVGTNAMMHTQSTFAGASGGNSRQEAALAKRGSNFMISPNASKFFSEDPDTQFITRRVENMRPRPRFVVKDAASDDEDGEDEFTASPAEDIPRNRLVDKLVRGLQAYIQRMQKRESYRIDVKNVVD